jgi:bifunctional UDP-N-acetylglucosamine pyrophosphorylase / glucosamine-1-phosphate N-acetyltransferase
MAKPRVAIVIMAAGKGTRLKSKHPKVLHEVGGKPLLMYVIGAATQLVPPQDVFAIIGHEAERVRQAVSHTGINFVLQEPQRGTGHALMAAKESLRPYEHVLVLSGDAPLITGATIRKLHDFHISRGAAMTILSAFLPDPTGYGRVLRKGQRVQRIVEQKSATPQQLKIREINSGFYGFNVNKLSCHIDKLATNNPHREFYLTDLAEILSRSKEQVLSAAIENPDEILGANSRSELVAIDQRMRAAKCHQLMAEGVTILSPSSCVIDADVQVGPDTVIEPFVRLRGKTKIGSDARVGSFSVISNCDIAEGVNIQTGCILEDSQVRARAGLGPYSHVRPGCDICEEAHVGNFVEMKKTRLGKNSKANHLTYLGDSEIGEGVNVGAGTITCNYDGVHKHKTVIEDGVFIGSDSILVAPIRIGKGAYVAAGSCLTEDVPADSLALGRARQTVKQGWAREKRAARAAKKSQ